MSAPDAGSGTCEVYALKYAESDGLPPDKVQVGADSHHSPYDLTYYTWLIRDAERMIAVDCGFNQASDARRGHRLLRTPADGLRALGVDPARADTLIITHPHYDHFGNAADFPRATLHVQDRETSFATGRSMRHAYFRDMYDVDDVTGFVRNVFADRVVFHDGDGEIAPGIIVHLASGHTPGIRFVRVRTRSGWLVLVSNACHFTFLRDRCEVYPVEPDPAGLIETYARLRALASDERLVIPGHVPAVTRAFPPAPSDPSGLSVRFD